MTELVVRYGETEEDVVAIHQFLLEVAQPVLLGRVDIRKSLQEVLRVTLDGVALLALYDGQVVGVLGLTRAEWWYGPDVFLTDRFFFVRAEFQHLGVGARLLAEAHALGISANLDVIVNGHMRRRNKSVGRGLLFTLPIVLPREPVESNEIDIPEFIPVREVMH